MEVRNENPRQALANAGFSYALHAPCLGNAAPTWPTELRSTCNTAGKEKALTNQGLKWRPGSESNRRTRICNPLHNHSATRPSRPLFHKPQAGETKNPGGPGLLMLEREKGLEPSTSTLARLRSTN